MPGDPAVRVDAEGVHAGPVLFLNPRPFPVALRDDQVPFGTDA